MMMIMVMNDHHDLFSAFWFQLQINRDLAQVS